ncbi:MAG: hypothetical protein JWP97_6466 [Labilithrix sp.]|nr:hypothetical protein [Labilithrix sp.]
MKHLVRAVLPVIVAALALPAQAQAQEVEAAPPLADPAAAPASQVEPLPEPEPEMSEGRRIVVAWNTGFQWGISPGVFFRDGEAGFALAVRLGYGFDTGSVIVVPGARVSGYFSDPNTYLAMPVLKLVLPIDRFAPFVEGGVGAGLVSASDNARDDHTGLALMVGGGFMVHFTMRFGLGVEANYQVITGSDFKGFGVGPILALAF